MSRYRMDAPIHLPLTGHSSCVIGLVLALPAMTGSARVERLSQLPHARCECLGADAGGAQKAASSPSSTDSPSPDRNSLSSA